jgi:peptidoglycan/xylan/chitin deacetylase (PgdA/CDA1 family)
MSEFITAPFAQPRIDTRDASLAGRISGKLSRFLARNVRTKTLTMRNARPLVTFTFDDVAASACNVGARMLEQYDVRGTYYISGGGCGAASPGGRLATIDEIKALHAKGHELGCHTYSHAAIASISSAELASDLERNRLFLNGVTGGLVARNFAYPYGDLSFRTKRYLESCFDSCRSLIPGVHSGTMDLGALKTWALENASIDRGRIADVVAETVRTKGWLIFNSHDVDEQPSRFGVSPDLLAFALKTACESGCLPVTIAGGLALVRNGTARACKPSR